MNSLTSGDAASAPDEGASAGPRIVFVDGAAEDQSLLRHQVYAPIKGALSPATPWRDGEKDQPSKGADLRVSLFPKTIGEVLLTFDLADRNYFSQFNAEKWPFVRNFRKILAPGAWTARRLTQDPELMVDPEAVVVVGSPRVDYLRALQAQLPPRPKTAPFRILFAPLHEHWHGVDGPMSCRAEMEPHLELLRGQGELILAVDERVGREKRPATEELLAADVVITDYTSLIYEAWALGKPVIFPSWITRDRILERAPDCAEAHIHRERIGHHPESLEEMLKLLAKKRRLDLGAGVEAFLGDYLANAREGGAGEAAARELEGLLGARSDLDEEDLREQLLFAQRAKEWPEVERLASALLPFNSESAELWDSLARARHGRSAWREEAEALARAAALKPEEAGLRHRLGLAAQKAGRPAAAAAAFASAIELAPKKATADWFYRVGYCLEKADPADPDFARLPQISAAQAYAEACAKDETAAKFGVGALHAKSGRWREAQAAYRERLRKHPLDAELRYRLGMSHDRLYEWAEAESCYEDALALGEEKPQWRHRLGFVLERQEKFAEAAEAYLQAARGAKTHQAAWFYRAGYALEKLGRFEEACAAYLAVPPNAPKFAPPSPQALRAARRRLEILRETLESEPKNDALWEKYGLTLEELGDRRGAAKAMSQAMAHADEVKASYAKRRARLSANLPERRWIEERLAVDASRAKEWRRLSDLLEEDGEIEAALDAARQALMRGAELQPLWSWRLGCLLMRQERFEEACAAFRDQRILQRPHGISEAAFETTPALRETAAYREFFDVLPLVPRTILYESFSGEGCSDNPLAIFRRVEGDPRFKGWLHVWALNDLSRAPKELLARKDVIFIVKKSLNYQRWLATAEYLITNASFPAWHLRKEGQKYLNTWHGTPLKTLGYDINETPIQRANTARNLIQASLFIAPNAHTEHVMLDRYGVRRLFSGRSLLSGYPRIDLLINATEAEKAAMRAQLGLTPGKPMVLFAPTYRGYWATPELEAEALIATIERMKSPDYDLVFRGHYFAERFIMEMGLPVKIAPHSIDSCSLLSIVDVLVSDYSSIFYDFLVTGRPIIHYVPDWDEYAQNRGLYFGKDEIPGLVAENDEELVKLLAACVRDPKAQISARYRAAAKTFGPFEDGQASARVVEAFFFEDRAPNPPKPPQGRKALLVHGGALDAGPELEDLRALLAATKAQGHSNTLVVDRHVVVSDEARIAAAQSLTAEAEVIVRFGRACMTLEEEWLNEKLKSREFFLSPAMRAVFEGALRHEARRLFGEAHFDVSLDLDGARPFWVNLFVEALGDEPLIRLTEELLSRAEMREVGIERHAYTPEKLAALLKIEEAPPKAKAPKAEAAPKRKPAKRDQN